MSVKKDRRIYVCPHCRSMNVEKQWGNIYKCNTCGKMIDVKDPHKTEDYKWKGTDKSDLKVRWQTNV